MWSSFKGLFLSCSYTHIETMGLVSLEVRICEDTLVHNEDTLVQMKHK